MVTSFIRYLLKQIGFFVFQIKMKNEKQTSNLNFHVQLLWKSKNHLILCFTSQLQYRNENQNFISNFVFQFIKKAKWHLRYTDCLLKLQIHHKNHLTALLKLPACFKNENSNLLDVIFKNNPQVFQKNCSMWNGFSDYHA